MATSVPLEQYKPLMSETPTWVQIKSMNNIQDSSFSELLGKLQIGEIDDHDSVHHDHVHNSSSASSTPSSCFSSNSMFATMTPERDKDVISTNHHHHRHSDSFSSMNSESLSLCTEGLGLASSDGMEDCSFNDLCDNLNNECQEERRENSPCWGESKKRAKTSFRDFPPPISCIGKNGKPWVCFKSYRENGRFILKEIRIPRQDFLHACRENGRLRLRFVHSSDDDEVLDVDDDGDEKELD